MTSTSQHLRNCVTASGGIDCRNPALLIGAADKIDRLNAAVEAAANYIARLEANREGRPSNMMEMAQSDWRKTFSDAVELKASEPK